VPRIKRNLAFRVPSALQLYLFGVVGSWLPRKPLGTHLDMDTKADRCTESLLLNLPPEP
jgi:hypothetical protein